MTPRNDSDSLPGWMREALGAPVASRDEARAAIMQAVRAVPVRRLAAPRRPHGVTRWRRRGALTGMGGALVTAVLALMLTVRHGEELSWRAAVQVEARVRGDSVIPTGGTAAGSATATGNANGDSLVARVAARVGGRLLDTMRIVDLALRGPHVGQAVITVADAQVQASLVRTSAGASEWHARALVPRDMVALTMVVDGASRAVRLDSIAPPSSF
jgi:hypothetical protein